MTYDLNTPGIARLWHYEPDWNSSYRVTRSFLTDIITSRSSKEQRRALRDAPRIQAEYATVLTGTALQSAEHSLKVAQNRPASVPDWSRFERTTALASGGSSVLEFADTPWWAVPGQILYLSDSTTHEQVIADGLPSSIYFLLDRSASLSADEFDAIKTATLASLDLIEHYIRAGIRVDVGVRFYSAGSTAIERTDCDPADIAEIRSFVSDAAIVSGGDVLAAWEFIEDWFTATVAEPLERRAVVFVTDANTEDNMTAAAAGPAADMLDPSGGVFSTGAGTAIELFAINYVSTTTTYTSLLDNTAIDGVPVISSTDNYGLVAAMRRAMIGRLIPLTTNLANAWAAGTVVRPAFFGLLGSQVRQTRYKPNAAEIEVSLSAYPGGEPHEPEGSPTDTFNGLEVLTADADWQQKPTIEWIFPVEQVDYGQGRTAQFRPVEIQQGIIETQFSGLNPAAAQAIEQVFLRAKGRRGTFYRSTCKPDMTLNANVAGSATFVVQGRAIADDMGAIDFASRSQAIEILKTDGSRIRRLVTGIALSGGNTAITVNSAVTLTTATVAKISWLPRVRFASDELTTEWVSPLLASIRAAFQTVDE